MFRVDPGPCPLCGAAHTACTAGSGPIRIDQLPALTASAQRHEPPVELAAAIDDEPELLVAENVQKTLPPGSFTTATYRGKKARP